MGFNFKKILKRSIGKKIVYNLWDKKFSHPDTLYFECSNLCNALCVFCCYKDYKDEIDFKLMDIQLFARLIDEFVLMGGENIALTPTMADPLTDKFLPERVKIVDESSLKKVSFYTNLISFKSSLINEIENITNTQLNINVSFSGLSSERYFEVMGVNKYDRVIENLKKLARIKNPLVNKRVVIRITEKDKQFLSSFELLMEEVGLDYTIEDEFDSWGGKLDESLFSTGFKKKIREDGDGPCRVSFQKPLITVEGFLKLCDCRDADNELIVHNLNELSLDRAWASDEMRDARLRFLKKETMPSVCQKCEIYRSIY